MCVCLLYQLEHGLPLSNFQFSEVLFPHKKRTKELGFRLFSLFFIFVCFVFCFVFYCLRAALHRTDVQLALVVLSPDARADARLEVRPSLCDVLLLGAAQIAALGLFDRAQIPDLAVRVLELHQTGLLEVVLRGLFERASGRLCLLDLLCHLCRGRQYRALGCSLGRGLGRLLGSRGLRRGHGRRCRLLLCL